MSLPKPGDRVSFFGGTGRQDQDRIIEGIVNGETIIDSLGVYVPVHVPETNQNVMVAGENLCSSEES